MPANAASSLDNELAANDLGPLAWVLEELRKSLDGATKAIRRFVRDAELARGSDLESLDASQLRIARQQLHQAVGALEMVGLGAPAKVLRAMEALAQKFVQRPELCSEDAAAKVERASFALSEYLEGVLRGKPSSSVALFPQYRDVLELVGEERIHPADLWSIEWRWIDAAMPAPVEALAYDPSVRARMDSAVLKMVKTGSVSSTKVLRDISLGFAASQQALESRVFWKICAAFFEAIALKLCPADVYVKRAASRVLMQYTSLARGSQDVSDRLAQDLLFFCAQAAAASDADAPVLSAIRQAYGLSQSRAVDYETVQFGRFDPALLVQVRKRIAAATETWSALAGGDTNRLKVVSDQFNLVSESLLKLHPENSELSRALLKAVEVTVRSGEPPTTPVAMEVATAILYLDAAYEDMDPTESQMAERGLRLARRLDHVIAGGQPEPLEGWMEELYRRVSDRQTMGSVVEELRTALTVIEKSLDQFFRNPQDKQPLHEVPSQLAQMRGVFSVLGLDQASLATLRMRDSVEKFLVDNVDEATTRSGIFEKLGNSLGALGFLIDMLSYQRALAKKLFVYDEELGEFKPLMGRDKETSSAPVPRPVQQAAPAKPVPAPAPAKPVSTPAIKAPEVSAEDDGAELRDIFLEEAREVIQNGLNALRALAVDPADLGQQTTLRRAFHTLKGSSRMVGFNEFGEAAWALEQLLNSWLAEQKPAGEELLALAGNAMRGFDRWVEDIAVGTDSVWSAAPFRQAADAMRIENKVIALELPGSSTSSGLELPVPEEAQGIPGMEIENQPDFASTQMFDFDVTSPAPPVQPDRRSSSSRSGQDRRRASQATSPDSALSSLGDVGDIDFSSLAGVAQTVPAAPSAPSAPAAQEEETKAPSDWGNLLQPDWGTDTLAGLPAARDVPTASPTAAAELPPIDWSGLVLEHEMGQARPAVPPESVVSVVDLPDAADEQIKVIGPLRIGIPLYNVYLNEADEWSRRLLTELNEWALELHRPIADSSVALAHSLAGSSGTVGFMALSEIARALEHALQHVQLHAQGLPEHAQVFVAAAENIRHLLHQFAAGFLKEPEPGLLDALAGILSTEFVALDAMPKPQEMEPLPGMSPQDGKAADLLDDLSFDFVTPAPTPAPTPKATTPMPSPSTTPKAAAATPAPAAAPKALAPMPVPAATPRALAPAGRRAGAAQIVVGDHDDEIDAVDNIDADLFPIFEEEAAELLPQLGAALRQWSTSPDNMNARLTVLRVLHTLKGSARLAGAMRLGEMSHRMESVVEQLGTEFVQASQIEPMFARFDRLQQNFDDLSAGSDQAATAAAHAPAKKLPAAPRAAPLPDRRAHPPVSMPKAQLAQPIQMSVPARQASGQSVRVRSQLLDRLVNQAGEVMITRSRLDARLGQMNGSLTDLTNNLDRLRDHLRNVEMQAESQMQSRLAQAKDSAQGFDPLEFDRFTRVQELTRMMAESVNDVATVQRNLKTTIDGTEDDLIAQGRQARELQRDLLRTRMIEFEGISERLYGVVRQASKDTGKLVKLDITGGTLEIDRGVLDRMAPAFEHMLRNAVAHGIEEPAVREAAGKPAAGTITIDLHQEGNDVSVTFSDDGAGLNLQRIREKALSSGLVASGTVLSDADTANIIFMPGFSTAASVTELSGRGIGMDVVRSEVNALGGRIETSTELGRGTSFKLVLPLTTAVTQVIMLRMGNLTIGVPANLVEIVRRTTVPELEQSYQSGSVEYAGETVPFYWAGALLQASSRSHEHVGKTRPVVMLRSAGQRLATHVDEVLGNQEVVVKNLGPQLSRLPGLAGMSVLASGAVVLIYNPVALATVYGEMARELQQAAHAGGAGGDAASAATGEAQAILAASNELPLVLVVDDSITVRRVTQRLLKREGYRVAMAADGLQALERLQEERPTVVLSDIEMPRMDGFDLARNIRMDARLKDLPIIMITSRIAEKHREHARELGVNHYLGKPYSEDELLDLVRHYSALAVTA